MKNQRIILSVALGLLLISALAVVYSKHQNRQLYFELVELSLERDALNVEWGQLRLEHSAVASHRYIEQAARKRLKMRYPQDIKVLVNR